MRAAVEDDQAVGDLVHMREVVLDIDAGAAGLLDAAHEVEDLAHLLHRQRRGRLVEHDEVGVVVHGAADGDALPLAAGKLRDGRIDRDAGAAEADRLQQDVAGDLLLALDVDEAEAVGDLPADEEIAPERLLVGERAVLVDGLDRQSRAPSAPNSADGSSSLSRMKMRPEVGASTPVITLISVDLPAPLSPISPTISLRPMASETSRSACTAPKDFCTFSSRTMCLKSACSRRVADTGLTQPLVSYPLACEPASSGPP